MILRIQHILDCRGGAGSTERSQPLSSNRHLYCFWLLNCLLIARRSRHNKGREVLTEVGGKVEDRLDTAGAEAHTAENEIEVPHNNGGEGKKWCLWKKEEGMFSVVS